MIRRVVSSGFTLLLILVPSFVPALSINGLSNDQVLQRTSDGNASAMLSGALPPGGSAVRFRALHQFLPLAGKDWSAAAVETGDWSARIEDLPTGGPYRIEVEALSAENVVIDRGSVDGVLVGDLWVLAGQSNMEGVGNLVNVAPPSGMVHMFDMSDQWRLAEEPLHSRPEAVHPVYWNVAEPEKAKRLTGEAAAKYRKNRAKGAGLGLSFGVTLAEATGVPVGLLPCAYGGTSMDQWSPTLKDRGSNSLYGAMMNRIKSVGGKVTGVVWYQGESDANPNAAPAYKEKLRSFIESLRSDLHDPALPFYLVQIGRFVVKGGSPAEWNAVQEAQRRIAREMDRVGAVAAVDLELDDLIHADTEGLKAIGRRAAMLAGIDLFADALPFKHLKPGPDIVEAVLDGGNKRIVRVRCDGVNGKLVAAGKPWGFSCSVGGNETAAPQPFKIQFDPDDPESVLLLFQDETPPDLQLWYGRGLNPYCNIGDEAGLGLLAAGPIMISGP